jgi:hypothetical protein
MDAQHPSTADSSEGDHTWISEQVLRLLQQAFVKIDAGLVMVACGMCYAWRSRGGGG